MANVLNLGNALAQVAYHQNVNLGQSRFDQNFVKPNVAPLQNELAYACLFGNFVILSALVVGQFFLLPTTINGPPPTIENLSQPGMFQLAVFKVAEITATHIGVVRISTFENDLSAATASINAAATYGPPHTRLFYTIPGNFIVNENEPRFFVAEAALAFNFQQLDPANAPAMAAPIVPQLGAPIPQLNPVLQLQQVIQGQQAATKENTTNLAIWKRLHSLQNTFSPGQFLTIIHLCMMNLPGGQPPSAGYLNLAPLIANFRNQLFNYASYQADRTVVVTDTYLSNLIQLNFSDIHNSASFIHLATPAEIPITYNNIKSFMGRMADHISPIYGVDLAFAVVQAIDNLVSLKERNLVIGLSPQDCINLVERQLFQIDHHFLFTTDVVQNPAMLAPNLAVALKFDQHHDEVVRITNAKLIASHAANAAALAAYALVPPPGSASSPRSRIAKRKTITGSAPSQPPLALTTRAGSSQALRAWRAKLDTDNPLLAGIDLPCLYWLSNIAPCLRHVTCQKSSHKQPHVVSPVITAHKAKILAWLKTDPLGRF